MHFQSIAVALVIAAPLVAIGHHGAEFAALEGFDIGHQGEGYVLAGFDFESFASGDELSSEVSLFISPLPRIGIGADVRFAESSDSSRWEYSSVTPRLTFQLSDPHGDAPVKFGISIGYQFARDLRPSRTVTTVTETVSYEDAPTTRTVTTTRPAETSPPASDPGTPACDPRFDLDCPTTTRIGKGTRAPTTVSGRRHGTVVDGHTTTNSQRTTTTQRTVSGTERRKVVTREETTTTTTGNGHSGIHNHTANQWVGRLSAETWIGKTQIVANLIATLPEGDRTYLGYGIGARRQLKDKLGMGLEFIGDFDAQREHEAIGSLLYDFRPDTTLRISSGVGLTSESPRYTLRAGLLWRF